MYGSESVVAASESAARSMVQAALGHLQGLFNYFGYRR